MLFGVRGTGGWGECLQDGTNSSRRACAHDALPRGAHPPPRREPHGDIEESDDRWPVNNKNAQATVDAQGKRSASDLALRKQPMP